jgi:UDP-N-acetylmuramyl pentapeptide synthase
MIELGISPNTIAERVAKLTPVDTRINVIEGVSNCMVIADSYTSDYNSLSPAINFMARRATASRTLTVIVSDVMKESYRDDNLYQRIADLMKQKNIDRVIGIGPDMCAHSQLFDVNSEFYQSTRDFLENTSPSDFENELILVKGAPEFEFQMIVDRSRLSSIKLCLK